MSRLDVQFLDQGFHRVMFDAMPLPVFVVDPQLCVLEYNSAAAELVGGNKKEWQGRRPGDILHCVHALTTPEGCGHAVACPDCVLRNAVREAAAGHRVTRQWARFERSVKGVQQKANLRVTSQLVTYGGHSFVLLVLEGLND